MSEAERLRNKITAILEAGTLAGSERLDELASLSNACVNIQSNQQRAVAYALNKFLRTAADHHSERPISQPEVAAFELTSVGPIKSAADFIVEGGQAAAAIEVIVALIDAERAT